MKRDWELVRDILHRLEKHGDRAKGIATGFEGYPKDLVQHHFKIMQVAGLIRCLDLGAQGLVPHDLTWEGHDFLDKSRNETVWRKAKAQAGKLGLAAFKAALTKYALEIVKS